MPHFPGESPKPVEDDEQTRAADRNLGVKNASAVTISDERSRRSLTTENIESECSIQAVNNDDDDEDGKKGDDETSSKI